MLLAKAANVLEAQDVDNMKTPKAGIPALAPYSAQKTPDTVGELNPEMFDMLKK